MGDKMENGADFCVVRVYWMDERYEGLHGVILPSLVLPYSWCSESQGRCNT